jgi:RHS repeat-associated protein
LNGKPATTTSYLHHDHLGSLTVITDETGAVTERLAYDPWGKRRYANGVADVLDSIVGYNTDRGFTMHEHLDEIGIIHMNGRIYDPLIGRFMSADPFVQSPSTLQSYNRYAYVMNNPLNMTDPSGYWGWGWIAAIAAEVGYQAGIIDKQTARTIQAIGIAYETGQWVGGSSGLGYGPVAGGAAGGAAGGYVGSDGNLQAAAQGAFTGALFGWAGLQGGDEDFERYAAHAAAGCVSSAAGGGNCSRGATAAVFGKFATNATARWEVGIAQGTAAVVAGGVGSVIAGGKFENGARTAAFGYLFNQAMSAEEKQRRAAHVRQNEAMRRFATNADMAKGESLVNLDPARVDAAGKLDITGKALMVVGTGAALLPPPLDLLAVPFFSIGAGTSTVADALNADIYKIGTDAAVDAAMTRSFPISSGLGTRAGSEVMKGIKNIALGID